MIPSQGRIVQYTLTENDVKQIMRRRQDAKDSISNGAVGNTGFMLHVGNDVRECDTFPLMITRVWGSEETSAVNGQVHLDGNDCFWVSSVTQGEGPGYFREFPRV